MFPSLKLVGAAALIGLCVIVAFVHSIIRFRRRWKTHKLGALFPPLCCLLITLASPTGAFARKRMFNIRFERYSDVVERFMQDDRLHIGIWVDITNLNQDPDIASKVFGFRDRKGKTSLKFIYGTVLNARDLVYLYRSSDRIERDPYSGLVWPFSRRLRKNWFEVSGIDMTSRSIPGGRRERSRHAP